MAINMNEGKNSNLTSISIRVSKEIVNKIDYMAAQKGYSRYFMIKQILTDFCMKQENQENIIKSSLTNIIDILNRQNTETEYFRQLYLTFLNQWFLSHPPISRDNNSTDKLNAVKNKELFIQNFNNKMYNEAGNLYDELFANNVEGQKEDDE